MSISKIGFIGLGNIGKPMAKTLVNKGFDVRVYDVHEEPVADLERLGAKVAKSAKEIGVMCDVVIIMVRDAAQAEVVILGKGGVLEGAKEGSLIMVMSTVAPLFCQRVARIAAEKGVGVLDAPVSGMWMAAEAGTLTILVGGEERFLRKGRHVLEAMGKNIFHMGGIGMGQVAKIANNVMVEANLVVAFEGIALATKAGIERKRFLEVVQVSSSNSWAAQHLDSYRELKTTQERGFEVTYKDLQLGLDLARANGLHLPLLEFVSKFDFHELVK